MYRKFWKRAIDITLSVLAIIVLSWLYLITALLIKLTSKGPVLFKQERIGKDGKVFKVLKFRSMRVGAEKSGVYSDKKDPRVTPVGRFIRATSIDELPQLFNILKGDMALIGPRPPLTYHPWKWEEYSDFQRRMFEVTPGITGWAQVNGRTALDWDEKFRYDVEYVDGMSLWLDAKIIFLTVVQVLFPRNIRHAGSATMPEFTGG